MNTTNVPMELASSTPCLAENPSIPITQELATSAKMEHQDRDIQCSDIDSAQDFVSGIMRIVSANVNVSFLWASFIASQLEFFVKQLISIALLLWYGRLMLITGFYRTLGLASLTCGELNVSLTYA